MFVSQIFIFYVHLSLSYATLLSRALSLSLSFFISLLPSLSLSLFLSLSLSLSLSHSLSLCLSVSLSLSLSLYLSLSLINYYFLNPWVSQQIDLQTFCHFLRYPWIFLQCSSKVRLSPCSSFYCHQHSYFPLFPIVSSLHSAIQAVNITYYTSKR